MTTSIKILFLTLSLYTLQTLYTLSTFAQLVSDFRVNDDTTSYSQLVGKVGVDSLGNFVIVWQDARHSSSISSVKNNIYCQRFNKDGISIDSNFIINEIPDTSLYPVISVSKNGNFAIAWVEGNSFVFNRTKVNLRIFNYNGTPLTATIRASDSIGSSYESPRIGNDVNGNFVVAWNFSSNFTAQNIYFQRFNDAGNRIGSNENVSDIGVNSRKSNPGITVRRDGSFIICWQDNRIEPSTYDIFMQMYDSSGNKIGNNVRVNEVTADSQEYSKITSDSSGNFVIAWDDFRFYPNVISVCQFYNSLGQKIGNNFLFAQNTVAPVFSAKENGDIAAGIYAGSSPAMQRIKSDRTLWGSSFIISNQVPSSTKDITDIQIYNDRVINVWQDNRNGNFDIYCNIRSYNNPDTMVSVSQISAVIPQDCKLFQNYPNPFNPITKIPFQINKTSHVELKVFDNLGREIRSLLNKKLQPGIYETEFDSKSLPSGVYYYKMVSENFYESKLMFVLK